MFNPPQEQHWPQTIMWSIIHPSAQLLHPPTTPALPISKVECSTTITQCFQLSRRRLTISTTNSCLLALLLGSSILGPSQHSRARVEDVPQDDQRQESKKICQEQAVTQRAFLDASVDGEPVDRIAIGLFGDTVPFGAKRLSDLVSGAADISYRRKELVKITSNYVQHGGVRSYGVDAQRARKAGAKLEGDELVDEWEEYENCPGTKNLARSIGNVVRDLAKLPPKLKLVARKGKLEIDQEEVGINPHGTEFVISIKDSPELDASTLVVGKVLEGMEVVEKIDQVKTIQENTSSPYFKYLLLFVPT